MELPIIKTSDAPVTHACACCAPSAAADGPDGTAADAAARPIDPVCGMTVDPDAARAKALHSSHGGTDYYFCGKGCKLEFGDDPERYLGAAYIPTM